MVVNVTKIFQKMKNKNLLSIYLKYKKFWGDKVSFLKIGDIFSELVFFLVIRAWKFSPEYRKFPEI